MNMPMSTDVWQPPNNSYNQKIIKYTYVRVCQNISATNNCYTHNSANTYSIPSPISSV